MTTSEWIVNTDIQMIRQYQAAENQSSVVPSLRGYLLRNWEGTFLKKNVLGIRHQLTTPFCHK